MHVKNICISLIIKGKIKAGYYVVSALCHSCNKNITSLCRKAPAFRHGDIRHIFYIAFYGIILACNRNND